MQRNRSIKTVHKASHWHSHGKRNRRILDAVMENRRIQARQERAARLTEWFESVEEAFRAFKAL